MKPSILYTGMALDRAQIIRRSANPKSLMADPAARVTLYWRGRQLVGGQPLAALWANGPAVQPMAEATGGTLLLLGMEENRPVLALDLSIMEGGEDGPMLEAPLDGQWALLRNVGGHLPAEDAARLAYARGVLVWRERTKFCSTCGYALAFVECGHSGRCTNPACGAQAFPRTDPAVIVLVTDPAGRVLLGRQAAWAPGQYSCLAGFVEPGETLEEAVAREVMEETGIRVLSATYCAGQPWPFPSSLMVGFTALAEGGEPVPDTHELEAARWFSRAEVAEFGEAHAPGPGGLFLPRRDAISRHLIEAWLKRSD